jgi:hypothetical protein
MERVKFKNFKEFNLYLSRRFKRKERDERKEGTQRSWWCNQLCDSLRLLCASFAVAFNKLLTFAAGCLTFH